MALCDAVAAAEAVGLKLAEVLRPATMEFEGATFTASVGPFETEQVFVGAGFSPSLRARALVRKESTPATGFPSGAELTVTPHTGAPRVCQIVSATELLAGWELILADAHQGA